MINFRILEFKDMFQMYIWLKADHVKQWWKKSSTLEDIVSQYGKIVTGEEPDKAYIIVADDVDIGYIQTYFYRDFPDDQYNASLETDEYTAGVDLFIGHRDYIHKGYGAIIMKQFLSEYVFANSRTNTCVITPEPKNTVAIKMYEKSGFKWYKTITCPDNECEYLMIIDRKNFS